MHDVASPFVCLVYTIKNQMFVVERTQYRDG